LVEVTPFSVVAAGGFGGVVAVTFLSPRVSLGIGAPLGPVTVEGDVVVGDALGETELVALEARPRRVRVSLSRRPVAFSPSAF
jgi:hypothetical protein